MKEKQIRIEMVIIFFGIAVLSACQKEIWLDDVDRLLTNWTKKTWTMVSPNTLKRTYYWSNPKRFEQSDGVTGLWFIPVSGTIRETLFNGRDTIVSDFTIIQIDKNSFIKRLSADTSEKGKYIYYAQ